MPFKPNQDRRHHILRQRHRLTNWPTYEAGLRQRETERRTTPGVRAHAGVPDRAVWACRLAFALWSGPSDWVIAQASRAIDRSGDLVDAMLSERRDMAAAKAFFRSAKSATGLVPDRVTTDGHGSHPRAIRSTLGRHVAHRTGAHKNNRLEQDHRGVKGRSRCMRAFKAFGAVARFCRGYDELRAFLRPRTPHNQHVPANRRRLLHLRRAAAVLTILQAA